jgi:hypothetical protein
MNISIEDHTVRKMDLLLRCIQRRLQMQLSMARKFTLQPYRRLSVKFYKICNSVSHLA